MAGPRLGRDVQTVIKASKSGDWRVDDDGAVYAAGTLLEPGEFTLEQEYSTAKQDEHASALHGGGAVVLDTAVTEELTREGLANDLVRAVQQARRDAGLHVSDRISLTVTGDEAVFDATVAHRDHLVARDAGDPVRLVAEPRRPAGRRRRGRRDRRRRAPRSRPGEEGLMPTVVNVLVRRAVEDDLDAILSVGHRTWPPTYEPIAGADYVAMGLAKWWSAESTHRRSGPAG